MRVTLWLLIVVASLTLPLGLHADEGLTRLDKPQPLPRVLILGDSISMGYTPGVRQRLQGQAELVRPDENCGPTTRGLKRLDAWLGDGHWDVIHFNFGLHDLKYIDDQGNLVSPAEGKIQVPIESYAQNLDQLVRRLQATGAKLIWCSTTPVPEGANGRVADDAVRYNVAARRVMRQRLGDDAIINDLHTFCVDQLATIQQPANVHFTPEGSDALAEVVAAAISTTLQPEERENEVAKGVVYVDQNGNGVFDSGDTPLSGIRVSNGEQITATDSLGTYQLPVSEDAVVFVIKPRGYRTAVDDKQLPQFYYIHKPAGSLPTRYPGVSPTGPLPTSIDFALYAQREPDQFRAIMFGDPQPRDQQEIDYIVHDVVEELIGTDASFGVTLGDITFDALDLFEPQARAIALLGIPWYNVIGNHDVNYDARHDRHSDESFERVFGPPYYSFDYGTVHFLVLDDVEWLIDENGQGRYQGGFGERQMEFIRQDLASIPPNQLVVLMMHIPLTDVRDRQELYRLIEQRPFCMSLAAHTHTHEHRYITQEDGWRGPEPHHHVVNVTVSGGWWTGKPDERGIPHATMADGAPNGYSILSFDGHRYQLDYRAAGRRKDYQMSIQIPEEINLADAAKVEVFVNVFNGAENARVELAVDDARLADMKYTRQADPAFVRLYESEKSLLEKILLDPAIAPAGAWRPLPKPGRSSHLWRHELSVSNLSAGTHVIRVQATLTDGRVVVGHRAFRVVPDSASRPVIE